MKIEKVEVFQISIPMNKPFRFGNTVQENRDHLVVALHSEGEVGWGESGLLRRPYYNAETTSGAFQLVSGFFAELVVREDYSRPEDLQNMFAGVFGNEMALAVLDFAVWDLFAKVQRVSLAEMLQAHKGSVSIGTSIGKRESEEEFAEAAEAAILSGMRRVKCKIAPGFPVGWLRNIRETYPNILLSVDANSSFRKEHFKELLQYDSLSLSMIEQPFHPKDLLLSAKLQREMQTDICLDEGVENVFDLELAKEVGAARVLNIKPARVGGLTRAIELRERCKDFGFRSWVGGLMETGIGRATNVAFAATLSRQFPHDIAECGRYGSEELIEEAFELDPSGEIQVPAGVGIGVRVDRAALERFTVAYQSLPRGSL